MKAWNIVLFFTICLQLAAYVIASVIVMPANVEYRYSQYSTQYGEPMIKNYTIEKFGSDYNSGDVNVASITDYVASGVFMASATMLILGAIFSMVWAYPLLVHVLMLGEFWGSIFQVIIYFIYAISFFSWVSGKHPDATL